MPAAFAGVKIAAIGDATAACRAGATVPAGGPVPRAVRRPRRWPTRWPSEARSAAGDSCCSAPTSPGRCSAQRLRRRRRAEVRDVSHLRNAARRRRCPRTLCTRWTPGEVDWVTFTSSSTAAQLRRLLGPDYKEKLKGVKLASIGPITTQTLEQLGPDADRAG